MLQASEDGKKTIADIIQNFHKFSSMWMRKGYPELKSVEHIFYNYWDTCITNESSYYARLNYLYFNPVKHRYVKRPEDYLFGSYYYRFQQQREYLEHLKQNYRFDQLDLE